MSLRFTPGFSHLSGLFFGIYVLGGFHGNLHLQLVVLTVTLLAARSVSIRMRFD